MVSSYLNSIILELSNNHNKIKEEQLQNFIQMIQKSNKIFVSGKGRSGLMISAFANRLLHLGYDVSVIGEITTPHTEKNDLLIIASGSGETDSLISMAKKAKDSQVNEILITTNKESKLGKLANCVVEVPGVSKVAKSVDGITSIQPMGAVFEQMLALLMDAVVLELMEINSINSDMMIAKHANLE